MPDPELTPDPEILQSEHHDPLADPGQISDNELAMYAPSEAFVHKMVAEFGKAMVAVRTVEAAEETKQKKIAADADVEKTRIASDGEWRRMVVAGAIAGGLALLLVSVVIAAVVKADKVELASVGSLLTAAGLTPLVALLVAVVVEQARRK